MEPESTSESWKRCALLLVAPWNLPHFAFGTSATVSHCCGSLAGGWVFGTFIFYNGLITDTHYNTWNSLGAGALEALLPCGIIPAVFTGIFMMILFWSSRGNTAGLIDKYRGNLLALSFIPFVLPYTLWVCLAATIKFSGDFMSHQGYVVSLTNNGLIIALTSCWALPILFLAWLATLAFSMERIKEIAAELGVDFICLCGYDLRGSIAGGSSSCPECGEKIPGRLLLRANKIRKGL